MGDYTMLRELLASEESLAETRLRSLNRVLEQETAGLPGHILEALNHMRQNAEEDLSNILHIQSTLPGIARTPSAARPKSSPAKTVKSLFSRDSGAVLGQVDEGVEAAMAVTDDLFLIEGVEESATSPQSMPYSDEDIEDSELDEGIHIPSKRREIRTTEVAASLPVGIPWPAQITEAHTRLQGQDRNGEDIAPSRDIAASMAAIAKSVHTSSMFGDDVFGDLPRPRLNTGSKN